MKKKLIGTYQLSDFPPVALEDLQQNLAAPILQAINNGADPRSPASVPIANLCSTLHTLALMHDRIAAIYSLIYDAEAEKPLHDFLEGKDIPLYVTIWEDYQKYKLVRSEGEKKMQEYVENFESDPLSDEEAQKEFDKLLDTDSDM
jgi:hypothetical protein